MVKPYDERRAKLEKLAKEALAKVAKMDRARKGHYTEGPSVKLWRVLTGKKMLAFIRKKWTAEQLAHMTARARGEEGMAPLRASKPPTGQAMTPKRLEAQQATNLAACFVSPRPGDSQRKGAQGARGGVRGGGGRRGGAVGGARERGAQARHRAVGEPGRRC
jgi:uncharacterized membrane protein YgcG